MSIFPWIIGQEGAELNHVMLSSEEKSPEYMPLLFLLHEGGLLPSNKSRAHRCSPFSHKAHIANTAKTGSIRAASPLILKFSSLDW